MRCHLCKQLKTPENTDGACALNMLDVDHVWETPYGLKDNRLLQEQGSLTKVRLTSEQGER
jgi:hypothetical protein